MTAAAKTIPMYVVNGNSLATNDVQENYAMGFISLFRSIRQHWIWQDPVKFQWWCDVLLEVNHTPKKVLIKGTLIDCGRGQSLRSLGEWAKRWRTNISAVRRFFDLLKSEQMIDTESVGKTTRLTVCKYESYQGWRHGDEKEMTRKRKDFEKEMTTNNNDNNSNNGNNVNNDNNIPAASAAPLKKSDAALPHWERFVSVFENFYLSLFDQKYTYQKKDFGCLKKIYQFLQKRAEQKHYPWTEKNMAEAFEFFLKKAAEKDGWLKANFSIPNLLSQFNQIVNGTEQQPAGKAGAKNAGAKVTGADLNQAFAKLYP